MESPADKERWALYISAFFSGFVLLLLIPAGFDSVGPEYTVLIFNLLVSAASFTITAAVVSFLLRIMMNSVGPRSEGAKRKEKEWSGGPIGWFVVKVLGPNFGDVVYDLFVTAVLTVMLSVINGFPYGIITLSIGLYAALIDYLGGESLSSGKKVALLLPFAVAVSISVYLGFLS